MLTDAQCRNATCPPDKARQRLTDAGKEGRMALGTYPAVTLTAARKARDAAKSHKSEGRNPVEVRKVEKLKTCPAAVPTARQPAANGMGGA